MIPAHPGGLRAVPVSLKEGGGHREDAGLPALKMKMGRVGRHEPGDVVPPEAGKARRWIRF